MTKTIMILAIATAFVVGSVMTGTMAYATGEKNGKPFEALWDAIHALETAVSPDGDTDPSNEDQTLSGTGEVVLGTTAAGDGGGTVTCADITGDASLCDGDDAVGMLEFKRTTQSFTTTTSRTETVTCSQGFELTGGSARFTGSAISFEDLGLDGNGWRAKVTTTSPFEATLVITVICVRLG